MIPRGALIEDPVGIVTIVDDDDRRVVPQLTCTGPIVREGDSGTSTAGVRIKVDPPLNNPVPIWYRTAPETAESGVEFVPIPRWRQITIYDEVTLRRLAAGCAQSGTVLPGPVTGATPAPSLDSSSGIDEKGKRYGAVDTPLARVDRCADALVGPRCKDAVGRVANEAVIPVDVIGDTLGEENEVFYLEIRGTGDADVVSRRCRATIEDDDLPLVWIESAVEVQEPDSCVSGEGYAGVSDDRVVATCRIHASATRVPSVKVAWGTKDGTAQAPQDYLTDSRRAAFGSLTELPATVTIERDDDFEESDEMFSIEIRGVEHAVRDEERSSCQVTIRPGSMLGGCGGH